MKIIKELVISKPIENVWEILGNQFGEIDKWASIINHSKLDGHLGVGVIRSTETTGGPTKQELTSFNPEQYSLSYKAIAGTPFFAKSITAKWTLVKNQNNNTKLVLDFQVGFKGIGGILTPIVKKKLGKIGNEILQDLKYYVENEKPHPRKIATK